MFLNDDIKNIRKAIGDLNLDILFFCEIGMSTRLFLISFENEISIQINTWGHSDTSGVDTRLLYISKLFEIEDAQKHYSEK